MDSKIWNRVVEELDGGGQVPSCGCGFVEGLSWNFWVEGWGDISR